MLIFYFQKNDFIIMHKWALIILFFVLLIMPLNNEQKRRRRNIETDEQRDARLEEKRNNLAANRLNETEEQREARLEDLRNRNAANIQNETAEQREARLEDERNKKAAQRNNNKRLQEERFLNIARKVDMADFVEDETMTVIKIGTIFEQDKCQYCNAYLWPKETSYSCCNNGKLSNVLETVPPPPPVLLDLM